MSSTAQIPELRTGRLLLRCWRDSDRKPFAALNADAEVMEHFPTPLSPGESDAAIARYEAHFALEGFGKWAVALADQGTFIGSVGIERVTFPAPFTPAVEVGWRLAHLYWGQGFASEAALRVLEFAFDDLALGEVVAFTPAANVRSQRVMDRIGMTRDPAADFQDSRLQPGHPLARNVLYRIRRPAL